MQHLSRFSQTRNVDLGLSVGMENRGWALLHSKETSFEYSHSIIDLLFRPQQSKYFESYFSKFPFESKDIVNKFDSLYDELEKSVKEKSYDDIIKAAKVFLEKNPIKTPFEQGGFITRVNAFYTHRLSRSSESERSNFFHSLSLKEQEQHFSTIMQRVDILKAQSLALAATGDLWDHPADPISQIRSEIALTLHVAQKNQKESSRKDRVFDLSQVMSMTAYLPAFIFDVDPCTWTAEPEKPTPSDSAVAKSTRNSDKETIDDYFFPADLDGDPKCNCDCGDPECKPTDPCCGKINYYITDVLELREKTVAYIPSSLAYIENVAPGETRERVHQFSKNIEVYSEDETTTTQLEERDHQVTDSSKLQKEIKKQMQASLDVEAKITGTVYSVNTNASASRDVSEQSAREKFKEIVTKAKESIETESRSLRTRRVSTGTSEVNTHTQTAGEDAVVAKYFHVSDKKQGQVYSHGLHLMMDILIASPALRFKELQRRKALAAFELQAPRKPNVTLENIDPEKQSSYIEFYELTDAPSPPIVAGDVFYKTYQGNTGDIISVNVPAGYKATNMILVDGDINRSGAHTKGSISCEFGGGTVTLWKAATNKPPDITISSTIALEGIAVANFTGFQANEKSWLKVKITFTPIAVDLGPWKSDMITLIMENYKAEMQAYEDALAEHEMQFKEKEQGMHPFTAEEHIRTQMKQSAIHMLCEKFDDDDVVNLMAEPCGYPEINRKAATKATKRWHFFDRAFDWKRAEIIFYDYFRNPMCKWAETFDPDESNFMLKAFSRAGYARIQFPVTLAMEYDVLTYLKTGKTWGGNDEPPSDPSDPRYTAVTFELKHSYDCYQNDRDGVITAITRTDPTTNEVLATDQVLLEGSNFYLDTLGNVSYQVIDLDRNHEIFINGVVYRLLDITQDPASSTPNINWILTLDRVFESPMLVDASDPSSSLIKYKHAIGAKFIGDKFFFELPTDLIWLGDGKDNCLPEYPIDC